MDAIRLSFQVDCVQRRSNYLKAMNQLSINGVGMQLELFQNYSKISLDHLALTLRGKNC